MTPGVWQRTPPAFAAPVGIELPHVTPFRDDQPVSIPAQGPAGAAQPAVRRRPERSEGLSGSQASSQRTRTQSETARFLTEHTQQQLNRAFIALAIERGLDVPDTARLFAMIHAATADSSIACYEAKYHYKFWRPIQAIPQADRTAIARTDADIAWLPFVTTPAHPEYPSSQRAIRRLPCWPCARFFGTDRIGFTVTSTVTGTTHRFDRFSDFTAEVVEGRIGRHPFPVLYRGGKEARRKGSRWMFCAKFGRLDEPAELCG